MMYVTSRRSAELAEREQKKDPPRTIVGSACTMRHTVRAIVDFPVPAIPRSQRICVSSGFLNQFMIWSMILMRVPGMQGSLANASYVASLT